ncbi:MAG: formylglycine-generating enzyme family protein [Methylococcales bacterium]
MILGNTLNRCIVILLSCYSGLISAEQLAKVKIPGSANKRSVDMSLMPRMMIIPAGCFQMGSPDREQGRNKDESLHRVCVKSFKMAEHEVTIDAFDKFVAATQFNTDAERNVEESGCWSYEKNLEQPWDWLFSANWRHPVQDVEADNKQPVACVSLNDVLAYIHWLNQRTGHEYRLPTEVEWEYAARAGTLTERYWGGNAAFACRYENVADVGKLGVFKWTVAHDCEDGYFFAAPVASFRANKYGLHDMLGNVWEWTCSAYQAQYAGEEAVCNDQPNAGDRYISIRGGGWNADPARVRSASRYSGLAWFRQANLGFRLVRVR